MANGSLGLSNAASNFVNSYMMGKQAQAERAQAEQQNQIKMLMGQALTGQAQPEQMQELAQIAPDKFMGVQNVLNQQQQAETAAADALDDERSRSDLMRLASTNDPALQDQILEQRIADIMATPGSDPSDTKQLLNMPFDQRQNWIQMKASDLDIKMPGVADVGNIGTYNPRDYTVESFAEFVKGGKRDPSILVKAQVKPVMIEGVPYLPSLDGTYRPVSVSTGSEGTTTELTPDVISQQAADAAAKKAAATETAKLEVQKEFKPLIAEAVKLAESEAKERGDVLTDLGRMEASLPGIKDAVNQLIDLSSIATSTFAGKAFDLAVKESGFGSTKGADARAKIIAIVDNQVLPLLKETFGAAFTVQEGDNLKASLVDPDASPSQKRAQLEAFLAQKIRNIETKETQLKGSSETVDVSTLSDEELFN